MLGKEKTLGQLSQVVLMELDLKCATSWPSKDLTSASSLVTLKRLMINWLKLQLLLKEPILKPKRLSVISEILTLSNNTKPLLAMSLRLATWILVLLH